MTIIAREALTMPWATENPFLFSVHHDDHYPEGNDDMGVAASLSGRNIGSDFGHPSGWSMYHSESKVPGFPRHPHRGFETISVSRHGFIDHADSFGNGGRFGDGDVAWMTAGSGRHPVSFREVDGPLPGISHAEMFPLLRKNKHNRMELFQMWMMLPNRARMSPPTYKMLWSHDIPVKTFNSSPDSSATVRLIAGRLDGWPQPPAPPKDSYASDPSSDVLIISVELDAGSNWTLPAYAEASTTTARQLHRNIYFFTGSGLTVAGTKLNAHCRLKVRPTSEILLDANQGSHAGVLILQGRDIGEPVVQHGPFVGNSRADIIQAFADYQRNQFGKWPWPSDGVVHSRSAQRFLKYGDGSIEEYKIDL